jgi:uncharacterized membrane protein YfcA
MSAWQAVAILGAGAAAGAINAVVGSGTLITFPVLLAFGYPPVTANVSNTVGLVPGSASGSYGYRRELAGQRGRALCLGIGSALGGLTGAVLLLVLPASAFRAVVPAFIAVGVMLVLAQPRLARIGRGRAAARNARTGRPGTPGALTMSAVYLAGVYGGYFGAAQGLLLIAVLGLALREDLQRINALKNVLAGLVNLVAGLTFIAVAHIAWDAAGLIAAGSIAGGQLGAHAGRRLPPVALRLLVVAVGTVAIVRLLT